MDIIIYTKPEILEHKKGGLGEGIQYYWEFSRFPRNVKDRDRIYFAVKGYVVGSFEIYSADKDDHVVEWDCRTWKELKEKVKTKPFRGFRYKWW